jgi:hypothetical protein
VAKRCLTPGRCNSPRVSSAGRVPNGRVI